MKDRKEAKQIIQRIVDEYRMRSYMDLCAMVGAEVITGQITGESGQEYQFEVEAFWDNKKHGDIRLIGSIAPFPERPIWAGIPLLKWISIYTPLATSDFIKNSSDQFVGE